MKPEISVIVPIFNGKTHLQETLNSILTQSFTDFELLAVDDGSTDGSDKIIQSLDDKRIRYIRKQNGGLCSALNLGIGEARSPYIARNDQDDISSPNRLHRQLKVLSQNASALGLFSYNTKFGDKHRWANRDKLRMKEGEIKNYDPIRDGCLLGSTMLARTEALKSVGGFRQAYYPCDDWDLEFRLAEAGVVLVLQEPLVAYRFHRGANTYRFFAEMQRKVEWTKDSHLRRTQASPELTIGEFTKVSRKTGWQVIDQKRNYVSKLRMRIAGQDYLDGKYLSAAINLAAAAILNPADATNRIMHVLERPR